MNAHKFPAARTPLVGSTVPASTAPANGVGTTFSPCPECEGTGFFTSGDFHPDDPRSEATWDCENCAGTGEVEADFDPCAAEEELNDICADLQEGGCWQRHRARFAELNAALADFHRREM